MIAENDPAVIEVLARMYPSLKASVRLKKYKSFCWVFDTMGGGRGKDAFPLEACVLALCQGGRRLADLAYVIASAMDWDRKLAESFVSETLVKFAKSLDWLDEPRPSPSRFAPEDFLYELAKSPMVERGRFDSPVEASLVLTHTCNFRCIYCFNSSGTRRADELTTEQWLDVIEQLGQLGVLKCTVSGGEPTIHPGFEAIVRKLVELYILPYVCTNGSRVDDRMVDLFLDLKIPFIQISLDAASAETHDRLTAVQGTFPSVVAAIRRLIAAGITVYVKAVMTPLNCHEAEGLIDLCHGDGVKRLILDRFDLSNAGRGNERLFMSRTQEAQLDDLVKRKLAEVGGDMDLSAVTVSRCWSCKDEIISCGALRTAVTIMPNGNISLCEKVIDVPELTAGNVREQSVKDIWNSPRACAITDPPKDRVSPICRECEHFAKCRTGCFALTLMVANNPYDPDPRCWNARYPNNPYVTVYAN